MTVSKKQHGCLHIIQVNKLSTKIIPFSAIVKHARETYSRFPSGVPSIIMPLLETGMVYSEEKVASLLWFCFLYFQSYFENSVEECKRHQGHVLLVQLRKHHQDKLALLLLGNCFANQPPGCVVCLKKKRTGPKGFP